MDNFSDLNGARVLVIDDNEYQSKYIADLLADVKAEAVSVASGEAALDLLSDEAAATFSCVLMDLSMPGMDGFETAGRIRHLGTVSMSRLPIICMAGGGESVDEDRVYAAGMNGWIAKPINPNELYASLHRTMNQTFLGQTWNQEDLKGKSAYILSDDTESIGDLISILNECGIETQVFTDFDKVADMVEDERTFDFAFVKWSDQAHSFSITTKLKLFCYTTFKYIIAIASDWSEIETKATELGLDAYVLTPLRKYNVINVIQKLVHESAVSDNDEADFSGNKVLIVDDNEMTAMVLQNAFESFGAEADIVNDGRSALERLTTMQPNTYLLVFMDIFMPDMKGFDVAAQFRRLDREDAITLPIIGMSGNSSSQLVGEAIASGMNALLLKPVTRPTLKMYMEIFLNEKLFGGILSDCMKNQINELQQLNRSLEADVYNERFTSMLLRHAVENDGFLSFLESVKTELAAVLPDCECVCVASKSGGSVTPICRVDKDGAVNMTACCENCTAFEGLNADSIEQGSLKVADWTTADGHPATKVSIPLFINDMFDGVVVLRFSSRFELSKTIEQQLKILAGIIALVLERERHARNAITNAMETTFVLESSPMPIVVADSDGNFRRGNKWLAKIMGMDENSLSSLPRQTFLDALRGEDGISPIEEIASGRTDSVNRMRKVGTQYYQEAFNKIRAADGSLERIIGTSTDVTDLHRMLQREHLQNSLLATLISEERLNDAMRKALEKLANHYSAAIACIIKLTAKDDSTPFFVSYERRSGNGFRDCMESNSEAFAEQLVKCSGSNTVFISKDRNSMDDSGIGDILSQRSIEEFCGIRLTVDGALWGHICLFFDNSEFALSSEETAALENFAHFVEMMIVRHNNNNAIIAARDKAIEAEKSKTMFFAQVSHDIRTPLNSIRGYSQLLSIGGCSEEEQKDYLKKIIFSGDALLELVDDILDAAQLDTDRLTFNNERHDFTKLCKDLMGTFTSLVDTAKVELMVDVEPMPDLEFDIRRMRQILTNFISNATKFTSKGFIKLHATFTKADKHTGTLTFEVIDTGTGIRKEDIPKLAQPFVQVGPKHKGTGLGLSICKKLLHQMGGHMEIKSEYGKGSTFAGSIPGVRFFEEQPADDASNDTPGKSESFTLPPEATSLNVLIADDELLNIMVLKGMLKTLGISNIYEAKDGVAAFEVIKHTHIDVVLTDANMPNCNGKEFARKVRADSKCKDIPIYVITGESNYVNEEGNDVFNEVLFKPIDIIVLHALFMKICANK